jgi:hypothetical protein
MFYTEQEIREMLATTINDITFIFAKIGNCELETLDANELVLKNTIDLLKEKYNRPEIQFLVTCQPAGASLFQPREEFVYAFVPNNVATPTVSGHIGYFINEMESIFPRLDAQMKNVSLYDYLHFYHPEKTVAMDAIIEQNIFTAEQNVDTQLLNSRHRLISNMVSGMTSNGPDVTEIFASTTDTLDRYNICKGCDKFEADKFLCTECGCDMTGKVNIKRESCPLDKWLPVINQ